METSPDQSASTPDRGVARLLRHRTGEPLAKAKATLKDRLIHTMMDEVVEELADQEHVIAEATKNIDIDDSVQAAKETLRRHLLDRAFEQAVEAAAETSDYLDEKEVPEEVVAHAAAAFKQHLLDKAFEQALADLAEEQPGLEGRTTADDVLTGLIATYKHELEAEALRQAAAEVTKEADVLPEAAQDRLQAIKETYKQRMLDQILDQALDEIHDEVDESEMLAADLAAEASLDLIDDPPPDTSAPPPLAANSVEAMPDEEAATDLEGPVDEEVMEASDESDQATTSVAERATEAHGFDDPVELSLSDDGADDEEDGSGFFLNGVPGSEGDASGAPASDLEFPTESLEVETPPEILPASEEAAGVFSTGDGAAAGMDQALLEDTDAVAVSEGVPQGDGAEGAPPTVQVDEGVVYCLYGVFYSDEFHAGAGLNEDGIDSSYPITILSAGSYHAIVSQADARLFEGSKSAKKEAAQKNRFEELLGSIGQSVSFLPAAYGVVYPNEESIRRLLTSGPYIDEMDRLTGRAIWHLRVFRNVDKLHQQVLALSDKVKGVMADIKAKPRDGSQDIKKRMVAAVHEEMGEITECCANTVHDQFGMLADEVQVHAPGEPDKARGEMMLNHGYLIHEDRVKEFHASIEVLREQFGDYGFSFEANGPVYPVAFSRMASAPEFLPGHIEEAS